jgi:hypothetical protein
LRGDGGFTLLRRGEDGFHQLFRQLGGKADKQLASVVAMLVNREADAKTELGIVLKERIGPGHAASVLVDRVGRGGQVAAVDRRASGGVGDDRAVSEELGEQLDVRGFTAAGACAGELEERLEELHILHLREGKLLARNLRQSEEELPVAGFALAKGRLRDHVDGLVLGFALGLGRAGLDAERAAGAIFRRNLQGVLVAGGKFFHLGSADLKVSGALPSRSLE